MSAKRSNSRKTGRKPISAYAKLRKQHYDKQYRLDVAVFGHSRWYERMREAGRFSDDRVVQLRNEKGQFSTGYLSHQHTTKEELNFFLDDLVGAPSSIRFCHNCRQSTRKCRCWDEFPKYDFRLPAGIPCDLDPSCFSDASTPGIVEMLSDIRKDAPAALSEALDAVAKTLGIGEES